MKVKLSHYAQDVSSVLRGWVVRNELTLLRKPWSFTASRVYRPSTWTPEIFETKLWHFSHNINAWCDRKRDRFHAINWFFSNWPLYKITKLSTSGAYWIIHLLLCLSLPFVQTFLSLFTRFLNENGTGPYSPFRCPAFQDLLLYLGLLTLEKRQWRGGFSSWSSSSSLKNFWQCLFWRKKKGGMLLWTLI